MADAVLLYVAGTGDVEEAIRVIEEDGADVDASNANDSTSLHIASGRGDMKMIEALVRHGANVNRREATELGGFTPLHYAVRHADVEVVECLLNAGADPSLPEETHGFTPLHIAARTKANDIAKMLVFKGADIHRRDAEGFNASYWAREAGNEEFLAIPGMPAPAAASAEERYTALRTKIALTKRIEEAAAAKAGKGKKKAGGKKKKGKKKK